ncbi:MAG: kelch repeat-containing protein [Mucilaginibacter sp.]|uniref:Kelch repeat-containing protein n=1 Tax=Mucilaginibacter sp. TaxID=1882438 RepID=UPI0034E425C6
MKNKVKKSLFRLYLIAFVLILFFPVFSWAQGLMFCSNDSLVAKRTSYNVFSNYAPVFKTHLLISFDLLLWDKDHLGYIFDIAGKNNSYSLSYLNTNDAAYFNFNIDRVSNKLKIPLQSIDLRKRKWIKVKADFNLANNTVNLSINNKCYKATDLGFGGQLPTKLFFGKNQYYTEVPNMAIKNLSVSDNSSSYFFPLDEWKGNSTHDMGGEAIGVVENPVWLINDSYFWKPVFKHNFTTVAGINFDTAGQKLFVYKKDSLLVYNTSSNSLSALHYKNKLPVPMVLGKSIFNPKENKCYVYEAYYDVPKGKTSIAALDLKTQRWETVGKAVLQEQRHHHNTFYNARQDSIYLFGGYGSFKYYNSFYKYNSKKDQWKQAYFKGDKINPRFFSATGSADNKDEIFLFGGYGNESGNQIIGGKQFYDLYRVNLRAHTIKKCWNIKPKERFVPANNLILSADKKYFYVLCYPHESAKTNFKLYKFAVKDGSYEVVSAPINVTSEKIETDINLFYDHKTEIFYCSVQEFTNPQNSSIRVYSLAAPPVSAARYLQAITPKKKTLPMFLYVAISSAAFSSIIILVFLFKGTKKSVPQKIEEITEDNSKSIPGHPPDIIQNNAVYLLGEFLVFDKNSRNITYLFSPKIKQLFLLILLHSKNGKGISSKKISVALWPDKDVTKTKNIRGVTFNHLRNTIASLDGIHLVFTNESFLFTIDNNFFCDYLVICKEVDNIITGNNKQVDKYYNLIARGPLLTEMNEPWLDNIKQSYDERLIEVLLPQLEKLYKEKNFKQILELARLILHIDPFNDTAFKYELKVLKMLKGIEYSKKIYDQFSREYFKSLGEDYPLSFDKAVL